jgi:hypothetical protein
VRLRGESYRRNVATLPSNLRERTQSTIPSREQRVCFRLLGQCLANEAGQGLSTPQRAAQVHFVITEQAGAQATVGGETDAVA